MRQHPMINSSSIPLYLGLWFVRFSLALTVTNSGASYAQISDAETFIRLAEQIESGAEAEPEADSTELDAVFEALAEELDPDLEELDPDVADEVSGEEADDLSLEESESGLGSDFFENLANQLENEIETGDPETDPQENLDEVFQAIAEQYEEGLQENEPVDEGDAISDEDDTMSGEFAEETAGDVDELTEEVIDSVDEEIGSNPSQETSSPSEEEQLVVDTAEDSAEGQVEEQLEEVIVGEAENDVEESIDLGPGLDDQNPEEDADQVIGASDSDELNNPNIDETIDSTETTIAADDARIHLGQWLVMAEPQAFTQLAAEGYVFDAMTDLPSLGLKLAEVSAPASFDISLARAGVYDVVGSDGAEVDLNHFYTARHPGESDVDVGISPREAMSLPDSAYELALRIGIIDSAVDTRHPVFSSSTINSKRFTRSENDIPDFHGTAIASLLVANNDDMVGLVPQATLYSAAVFDMDSNKGEIASTVSLVRSLDWLLEEKVDVINLSLTGPSNRLLEVAINKVVDAGIVVLAAAGNDGPMATPKYPAAYSSVIAVTAVDSRGRAFRMANRGDYLALAAPGVNLRHAQPGRGYTVSSGTSFAVPFVTAVAALLKHLEPGGDVVSRLYASAMDLGAPGRDEIYGYGLLRAE